MNWRDMTDEQKIRHYEAVKRWRENNKDRMREINSKWNAEKLKDRDKCNARLREWRSRNKELVSAANKRMRAKLDPKKRAEYNRRYERKYRDKSVAKCVRRRARLANAEINSFTAEEWTFMKMSYSFKCAYCQADKPLCIDHVIPLSRGGNHCLANIVPACRSCNSKKGARDAESFKKYLVA